MSQAQRMRFTPIAHQRLLQQRGRNSIGQDLVVLVPPLLVNVIMHTAENNPDFNIGDPQKWRSGNALTEFGSWRVVRSKFPKVGGYEGYGNVGRFHVLPNARCQGRPEMASLITDPSLKAARDAIVPVIYHQFDLDNAMPNIIYHYFKHLGLPSLDHRIQQVMDLPKGSPERREAKKQLYRSLNLTAEQPDPEIHAEALRIKNDMEERYPGFVAGCRKKRSNDGKDPATWFSVACQLFYEDVESEIQLQASKELAAAFGFQSPSFFVADAVWVMKFRIGWASILEIINRAAAEHGARFSFVETQHGLQITDDQMQQLELELTGRDRSDNSDYGEWKTWFEKECFGDKASSKFVVLDHDRKTFSLKSKKELCEVNYHQFWSSNTMEAKKSLNIWFDDPNRKTISCIVNKPPPLVASDDEFNLWDFQGGFRASQLPDVPDDFNTGKAIDTIVACFRRLVGDDEEQLEYLLNYLACQLQEPARKVQQYMAFYGGQGTGKTELIVNFWGRGIIGESNYVEYSDLSQLFEKHEVGWMGKSAIIVNEVEHGDFTANYRRLKAFTGTISVKANEKCQSIVSVDNYSRIFMTSNCINAFAEKDMVSRRAGLRAAGYHYRDIPDSLATLRDDNAQRAFYDWLMGRDISEWEPERDRKDNELLAGANQRLAFFAHAGKEAEVAMAVILDRAYEILGVFQPDGSRERTFRFPTQLMARVLRANTRFNDTKSDGQWESIASNQIAAAAHDLKQGLSKPDGTNQVYLPFRPKSGKGKPLRVRCWVVNYLELKDKLAEMAIKDRWDDVIDFDDFADKSLAAVEEWLNDLGEKWEHAIHPPRQLTAKPTLSARRVGNTGFEVRDSTGALILQTQDLEEVNKALGETYVSEHVDEEGNEYRVLHRQSTGKILELNDWFGGEYWATKVALIYPDYVRDRTQT